MQEGLAAANPASESAASKLSIYLAGVLGARAYFSVEVGCGTYEGISENATAWIVDGKFGYAGQPIKGFIIDKRSGGITSPVVPSYAHPNDMLPAPTAAGAEVGH